MGEVNGALGSLRLHPYPICAYLCSLWQVHHGVWFEVVLILPAKHSSDDDNDDRDHSNGCQHCSNDPQIVGWVLHHRCRKEAAGNRWQVEEEGSMNNHPQSPQKVSSQDYEERHSCLIQRTQGLWASISSSIRNWASPYEATETGSWGAMLWTLIGVQ